MALQLLQSVSSRPAAEGAPLTLCVALIAWIWDACDTVGVFDVK
jgi:hypothetical protein